MKKEVQKSNQTGKHLFPWQKLNSLTFLLVSAPLLIIALVLKQKGSSYRTTMSRRPEQLYNRLHWKSGHC